MPETAAQIERRWIGTIVAVVVPGMLARRLLRPRYRIGRPDPVMANANRIRGWIGLAIVLSVFLRALYEKDKKATAVPSVPRPTGGTGAVPGLPAVPGPTGRPTLGGLPTGIPGLPTNIPGLRTYPPGGLPTNFPTGARTPAGGTTAGGVPATPGTPKVSARADEAAQVVLDLVSALIKRVILLPVYGALGIVVLGALLVLCAHPAIRSLTMRQLWYPVRDIVVFAAVPLAGFGISYACREAAGLGDSSRVLRTDGTTGELVLSWAAALISFWAFWFGVVGIWQVTRHLFSAVDGHPLLPALMAMWLAWTFTATDLFVSSDHWLFTAGDIVPGNVKAGIGLIGSAIISALAYWEIDRLRRWNGITLRSGPFGSLAPPPRT